MTSQSNSIATSAVSDEKLALILEQVTAQIQAGQVFDADRLVAEHPEFAERLRQLLPAMQLLADASKPDDTPIIVPGEFDEVAAGTLGDFRLIREVGRGGMGVVYEVEQVSLSRHVALKVLPFASTMDPRQLQRFKNEALAAASLRHEHIVHVYGVGCERGVHYYAMELIEGQTLAQVIAELRGERALAPGSPLPESRETGARETAPLAALTTKRDKTHFRRIAELIADAADALEYAHSMGVVHRDIKPGNLMLDNAGHLWITDFGLAKLANPAREGGGDMTLTGDLIGTLRYMSPEQALAKHGLVDHRTDIYSLGSTLYELLTLKPAVDGADKAEILKRIAWEEPIALRKHDKAIPPELETITLKCLAKEPGERYATAGEVADDLRRWLGDQAIKARPPTLLDRSAKWAGRHRGMVALSLTFVFLAASGLTASVFLLANKEKEATNAYEGEKNQRRRAQVNLELALQALDETSWEAVQTLLTRPTELKPDEIKRVERLLSFYKRFANENGNLRVVRAETFQAHIRAGEIYLMLGNRERAEQEFRKGQAIAESMAVDRPDDLKAVRNHYFALSDLGRKLIAVGKPAEAEQFLLRAANGIDTYRKQFDADFNIVGWQRDARTRLASLCMDGRRFDDAEFHYQRVIEHSEELAQLQPANSMAHAFCGSSRSNLAAMLVERGQHDRAHSLVQKAIECQNEAIRLDPDSPRWREFLGSHYLVLSLIANARKQTAEHVDALREYITILEYLTAKFPAVPSYRAKLSGPCYDLGVLLNQTGQQADALSYWAKVAAGSEQYPEACRAQSWVRLTASDEKLRDPAEALRLTTWGTEKSPESADWLTLLAFAQHRTGDSRGALSTLERTKKAAGEGEIDVYFIHAMVLHRLGERDLARERCGAAIGVMDMNEMRDDPILRVLRANALKELGLTEADFEKPKHKTNRDN